MTAAIKDQDIEGLEKLCADIEKKVGPITSNKYDSGLDNDHWKLVLKELQVKVARGYVLKRHDYFLGTARDLLKSMTADDQEEHQEQEQGQKEEEEEEGRRELIEYDGEEEGMVADYAQEGDQEEGMNDETEVKLGPGKFYHWHDKYRPRKPRYVNKVRTGWDWNKYNQTHYDKDNPPPRTIQGYKFTIFYPDMIDRSATPTYSLEFPPGKNKNNSDFVILRFHAPGGPYEDIAFQILNREWDTNRKSGFRCVFSRGQLDLHFNFRRLYYRR